MASERTTDAVASTYPFVAEQHTIGVLEGGTILTLAPMTEQGAAVLGPAIATIGPWAHYRFDQARMQSSLLITGDGAIRYQLLADDVPAGVVIIRSPWLAGPYLQILAVLPSLQGKGAGAKVLKWYEETAMAARMRNVWLCVSGFNVDAQRFYQRFGYALVGHLHDLMRDGDDELLMRKNLAGLVVDAQPGT
jgi:diamine N-acetyltransferase